MTSVLDPANRSNNFRGHRKIRNMREILNKVLFLVSVALGLLGTQTTTTTTATAFATFISAPPEDAVLEREAAGDACPAGFFQCNTSVQCVPQRLNCDGAADCDDASDEWDCVNDVDAKFWDHLFRKQPFGRHDDLPIGSCLWPSVNHSGCLCRGDEILCRFQQLTALPAPLPANDVAMLDLTGNNFTVVAADFLEALPAVESLVLKFCSIERIDSFAFRRLTEIPLKTLYLDENRISRLPQSLFPAGNHLRILILSGNRLEVLHEGDFDNLDELEELDLRGNRIESFAASAFHPLRSLEVLYLNENRLRRLGPQMFPQLPRLHTLSLAHNRIEDIGRRVFAFPRLQHLFLAGNRLTILRNDTFCDLHLLQGLHLNDNRLRAFEANAFACLENLTSLLLTGNDFKTLDASVLQRLTSLNYIYFSWFHLCRAALHVRVCEPRGDGISSTYHLLDNQILRASVWIMATVAVVGNLTVLLGRYFHKTRGNVEHSLYLRHLAASDLLMGVYLAIIASADIDFRGEYIMHEEAWRRSRACALSGFLNTFSCQSSTLLLTLVTWDRLMSVMRPLKPRDAGRVRIALRLVLLWGASFVLAAAPLLDYDYFGEHFYGSNGVCLSLHIHDPYAKGWEYSALLFICVNTVSLVFILASYLRMLQAIRDSGGGMRSTLSGRESIVATRFVIIVSTDCACWLPVIVVKLAALSGCPISPSLYAWLAVLVLPVNSALNPVLYTLTTAAFKQQLRRYCHTLPACSLTQEPRSLTQTQTQSALESGLSLSLGHFGGHNASGKKRSLHRRMSFV